jgi:hypothetical protein
LVAAASEGGPGVENLLSARLKEWTHLGDSARFRIELPGGTVLSGAAMPARRVAGLGQEVGVRVAAEDVAVLAE